MNRQKVVLDRVRATLDKIPPRRRSCAPRAHSAVLRFRNRPARSLASLVHRPLWRYGIGNGRLLERGPNPKTYGITVGSFADPDFRRQVVHPYLWKHPRGPE